MTTPMTPEQLDLAARLATQLRVDSIRCSTQAGSGHPTSSLSAADLMAVLMLGHLHYDWHQPDLPANDHLIFSKGHASPLLYSMFRAAGVVDENELITTYRQLGARLHPPRCCPGWTWPPAPSARDCPTPSVWAWPESTWTSCRITCGCCAGTAKPPKAPADVAMPSCSRAIRSAAASSRCLALALTCGAAPSCDLQTLAPLTGGSFQGSPVPQVRKLDTADSAP